MSSYSVESLLETLSSDESIWLQTATTHQCELLVKWMAKALAPASSSSAVKRPKDRIDEDEISEPSLPSSDSSSTASCSSSTPNVEAALLSLCPSASHSCVHLQSALKHRPGLRRFLSRRVAPPIVTKNGGDADGDDGIDFLCSGTCCDCEARNSLSQAIDDATQRQSDAAATQTNTLTKDALHAHCVGCLEMFLSTRRSLSGDEFTHGGFCAQHISAHWGVHKRTSDRIIGLLDDEEDKEDTAAAQCSDDDVGNVEHDDDMDLFFNGRLFPNDFDIKHEADVHLLESEAQTARTHAVYLICGGASHMYASVLYCAECTEFASLCSGGEPSFMARTTIVKEELDGDSLLHAEATPPPTSSSDLTFTQVVQCVTIANAILSPHTVHHPSTSETEEDDKDQQTAAVDEHAQIMSQRPPLDLRGVYLYKAVLFQDDDHNDALEEGATETFVDAWLPHALGTLEGLLQRCAPPPNDGATINSDDTQATCFTATSSIRGFFVCFESHEAAAAKVAEFTTLFPRLRSATDNIFLATEDIWVNSYILSYTSVSSSDDTNEETLFTTPTDVEIDQVQEKLFHRSGGRVRIMGGGTFLHPLGGAAPLLCPLHGAARGLSMWQCAAHLGLLIAQLSHHNQ